MNTNCIAAIEAGGTKFIGGIFADDGTLLAQQRIPTTTPDETLSRAFEFFQTSGHSFDHLGIGGFGPLDLDETSETHGFITDTPKVGWQSTDIKGQLERGLGCTVAIDTDVNCAALAELLAGAAKDVQSVCYLTVGTGIGAGFAANGVISRGASHAEAGHMLLAPPKGGDDFPGICPAHGRCAEGLASGPAMKARWGVSAEDLPIDHEAWEIEAHYIAAICLNITYIQRPQRIVLGGGVMERSTLYNRVRVHFEELANGYALDRYSADASTYIAKPFHVEPSPGLVGARLLAESALKPQENG